MPTRVLHIAADPGGAERVRAALERGAIDSSVREVTSATALRRCLESEETDLLIAEDSLGQGPLLRALRMATRLRPEVPVLVLVNRSGEAGAARAIRAGATDCVCGDELSKLPAAVRRAQRAARRQSRLRDAERSLRESEERYRAFVATSTEAIWRLDFDEPVPIDLPEDEQIELFYRHAHFAECNDATAQMYGYKRGGEMAGLSVEAVLPRNEPNIEHLKEVIRAGYRLPDAETVERDRHGEVKHILNNVMGVVRDGCLRRIWGTQRDITSIRKAEQECRAAAARTRAILDSAIDAIITIGADGRIVEFNPAAEQVFGHRREDIIGRSAIDTLVPRRLRGEIERELARFVETGESPVIGHRLELPGVRADGKEFPAELAITLTNLANGFPLVTVFVRDITERVEAEQAADQQSEFLQLVMDINPNLIFAKDRQGRFTLVNRAVAEVYGTTQRNLLGKTDADFNSNKEEVEHFRRLDLEVMDTLEERTTEELITDAKGRKHWLHTVKRPILGPHGEATHVLGVAVDITERKQSEEELKAHREHLEELVADRTRELELSHQQLRQSERMAMIGTLSTGLGHDMGNLLLPLRVRLDAMESRGLPPELQEDTRAIRTFTEYLQRLANGLRLLAQDPHEPGRSRDTTELHEWWPDVQPVLKNSLPRGVTLEQAIAEDAPRARIPRHVLTQVVFNLVQNAGEAMRDQGGTVSVWAEADGDSDVLVGVTDTGPGMSEEVRARCMEPFFTTKPRGISTGLGLALVHGLVRQSGGTIEVESEPERGCTFTLRLEAVPQDQAVPDADGRPRAVVSLRDVRTRSHVVSVLRSLAFEVEAAERPEDPEIAVWIADGDPRTLRLVREFASTGEHKHAVVFGAVPKGADFSRVTELPEKPKPSEIWRAARTIAERFELQRKDSV